MIYKFDLFSKSLLKKPDKSQMYFQCTNVFSDPLLQNCQLSASHLSMADMSVYMINSLQAINNTLAFYEFGVDSRLEMIQGILKIKNK